MDREGSGFLGWNLHQNQKFMGCVWNFQLPWFFFAQVAKEPPKNGTGVFLVCLFGDEQRVARN